MSTRTVAAQLSKRLPISHATIANFENGRSVPPMDVLAALATLYERPINWFLERGKCLTDVRYRNLKSRVRMLDLHRFEAEVQRWIDAYVSLEIRLKRPLTAGVNFHRVEPGTEPAELSREVRRELGIDKEDEPIISVVESLERFGIRVLENPTDLGLDGSAAKYGNDHIVVLNPSVPHERTRLIAAQELAYVLYGDTSPDEGAAKASEQRAFEFATHFLLTNSQLKEAFKGKSMVRLVQFKERFGISLAAMIYRAEKLSFITKQESKSLWAAFAERGWKTNEPGVVRPDRATRFEQLIDEALLSNRLSLREVADLAGARPEDIRERLNYAMGIPAYEAPGDEGIATVQFPR